MEGFFHSRANLLQFHIAVGVTWIAVFVVYGTFGFRTYLAREVLQREISLDGDDIHWLRVRVLGILGRATEPLPPQGIYNAGQKLFALMVYAMVPVIMITGMIMTFHLIGTTAVGWAAAIHFAAVGAVFSGLMIHVYMGAVFPEEKPAFFSMITGTVNEFYAYNHHFKWWREVSHLRAEILPQSDSTAVAANVLQKQGAQVEGEKQK
jgi:formate dehydrogenase subunit gamma